MFKGAGKFLLPLILFSSSAENEVNSFGKKLKVSMATHCTLNVCRKRGARSLWLSVWTLEIPSRFFMVKLSDDGCATIKLPIAKSFTKEHLLEAHLKMQLQLFYDWNLSVGIHWNVFATQIYLFQLDFYPFTQAIRISKKLRHEIGQSAVHDEGPWVGFQLAEGDVPWWR